MARTNQIAKDMGIPKSLVDIVAEEIGVGYKYSNGDYKIEDGDVPQLKLEILKWQKEKVQKYIDKFGVDSQHTKRIAKEYKMEELLDKQKKGDPLELKIEELEKENKKLTSENQSLKSQLSELQAKLDKIEKEKLETAEIVARIGEKFFK